MLLRPRKPLPIRFRRPASRKTRSFVERRRKRHSEQRKRRVTRSLRRFQRQVQIFQEALRRWLLVFLVGLALLIVGLLLFSPILQVREIRVTRSDLRLDLERIECALSPLFHRHLLFVSEHDVKTLLEPVVPDLQDVTMRQEYPSMLHLRVALEPLLARLSIVGLEAPVSGTGASAAHATPPPSDPCGARPELTVGSDAHYLTTTGRYVTPPLADSGAVLPIIEIADWGVRPTHGIPLVQPSLLTLLEQAEAALRDQFNRATTARTIFLRSREVHLKTGPVTLWFDLGSPLPEQLQRLRIFERAVPAGEVKRYIDLRIEGRVVYR